MDLQLAIGLVAGLIIGAGATGLYGTVRNQEQRIRMLEQAAKKHLPYATADEIENATAAILALKFDLDIKQDMVDNALAHLRGARNPQKSRKEGS